MNRCLNDCFCYCKGQPDAHVETVDITYTDTGGRLMSQKTLVTMCRLSPVSCGEKITQTQLREILIP